MGRANSAFVGSSLGVPLFGILSARAPDPFSKRAGDLSALRMAAVSCGLGVLFFRVAGGGWVCFVVGGWVCGERVPLTAFGGAPLCGGEPRRDAWSKFFSAEGS